MAVAYGRVAASRPSVTTELELWPCPASTELVGRLYICNQTGAGIIVEVAHTDAAGAATGEDWIVNETLGANSRIIVPVDMGALETIRIKAATVDAVSFLLSGMLKT